MPGLEACCIRKKGKDTRELFWYQIGTRGPALRAKGAVCPADSPEKGWHHEAVVPRPFVGRGFFFYFARQMKIGGSYTLCNEEKEKKPWHY